MKRIGGLWDELVSTENLCEAYRRARRGKRAKESVQCFEFHLERELSDLQLALQQRTYVPGPFRTFQIQDPKPRLISAAPFRDRVVHHAFCRVVEPVFERTFIHDSYACRRGKGTHAAVNRYAYFSRRFRYVLKCDVRKFFPSMDHEILLELLARKIKDRDVMWLAAQIISHSNEQEEVPGFFPGDTLFTALERRRGIPIGNQTSQFFANVYLNPLDHFVKESLSCRCYVRYCDDFVILSDSKEQLAEVRDAIERFLWRWRLWLHPHKRTISRVQDGIRFLGYRVWPNHRRLTSEGVRRFRKRLACYTQWYAAGRISAAQLTQRIRAWLGHAGHANTWRLRQQLLGRTIFVGPAATRTCSSGRLLEQQCQEFPLGQPQQEHARQAEQQQRVSSGQHWTADPSAEAGTVLSTDNAGVPSAVPAAVLCRPVESTGRPNKEPAGGGW